MAKLILQDTQKCALAIQPVDVKGRPARVDGVPQWAASDPAVATLEVAEDGLSATVVALVPGACQINVTADADLGEGVRSISGALDLQVDPSEAVALAISAGAPENQ